MHKPEFLGVGTVGERGQVSIPAEARKRCGIESGQKIVFLSMDGQGLVVFKADRLDAMFAEMSKHADEIHRLVKESEGEGKS